MLCGVSREKVNNHPVMKENFRKITNNFPHLKSDPHCCYDSLSGNIDIDKMVIGVHSAS